MNTNREQSGNEDPLDALLREHAPDIEDNGFSERVIQALPQRRRQAWVRSAVLPAAVVIGSALAVYWLPWGDLLSQNMPDIRMDHARVLTQWFSVLAVMCCLTWAAVNAGAAERDEA